ncbi:hypothetical protein IFM46972_05975 [Aspergillus udagawae]|uniref:Uncharacterized protein n=1 Tax=Aspergillus udagawae TaxID=91492 RepID=A0A8H3RVW8_9EURO|nr:hypothetical protein IFM46972_05975 [Aspergillus udagawae]
MSQCKTNALITRLLWEPSHVVRRTESAFEGKLLAVSLRFDAFIASYLHRHTFNHDITAEKSKRNPRTFR